MVDEKKNVAVRDSSGPDNLADRGHLPNANFYGENALNACYFVNVHDYFTKQGVLQSITVQD